MFSDWMLWWFWKWVNQEMFNLLLKQNKWKRKLTECPVMICRRVFWIKSPKSRKSLYGSECFRRPSLHVRTVWLLWYLAIRVQCPFHCTHHSECPLVLSPRSKHFDAFHVVVPTKSYLSFFPKWIGALLVCNGERMWWMALKSLFVLWSGILKKKSYFPFRF